MTYDELAAHLKSHGVRLRLKLTVQCDDAGAVLTPEVKAALAEHKPLIVARVANAMQRAELDTWEWGSQPGNGSPPF